MDDATRKACPLLTLSDLIVGGRAGLEFPNWHGIDVVEVEAGLYDAFGTGSDFL